MSAGPAGPAGAADVLEIDIGAFEGGRRSVVEETMQSLTTGFVYARHNLSSDLIAEADEKLSRFFALPGSVKERYLPSVPGMQAGYTGLGTETAVGANQPDMKEMLRWARPLPDGHPLRRVYPHQYPDLLLPDQDVPGITGVLLALQESLFDLQRRFLRIVAVGLGVDPAFFDDLLVDAALLNRAIFYPRLPAEGAVRAGEHADINLLTVLLPSSVAGLEIKTSAGWMAVTPPDGRVVLNSGLMLERLTNGAILAHRHRVVTPDGGSERLSIVQFCHPAPWMLLNPLPTCVTADRPLRYGAIQAGDIHQRVLWASRLMA